MVNKNKKLTKFEKKFISSMRLALEDTANEIGEEIELAYEHAISAFYNDYTPNSYDRDYNLYRGSSGYSQVGYMDMNQIVSKVDDESYIVGIDIDADNLQPNPYKGKWKRYKFKNYNKHEIVSAEWIFENAYFRGIHGFNRTIVRKVNSKRHQHTYPPYWRPKTIPTTMKPSPDLLMKRSFKRTINKKSHINEIFNKNIKKYI